MATNQAKLTKLGQAAQNAIRAQLKGKTLVKGGVYGYTQEVKNWDIIVAYLRAYLEGNYGDINNTNSSVVTNSKGIFINGINVNTLRGKFHEEDLLLTNDNDEDLWTYLGKKDTYTVTLPKSSEIDPGWTVILNNKSPDHLPINIVAQVGDTVGSQASVVYPYGSAIQITWSGKTNFLIRGYQPTGIAINSPGLIADVRDGYRLTIGGTYILPKVVDYQNRSIVGITFKNNTAELIILQTQPGDAISVGFGQIASAQITILPGDAALMTIIDDNIFDLITPELISENRYFDNALPFVTDSIVPVVASSNTTPLMNFGLYKLDIWLTWGMNASNRYFNAGIYVDNVLVTPIWTIQPKDAANSLPINYSAFLDWTAGIATHDIELRVFKSGGGGAADITITDFQYSVKFYNYA